jgi:predicted nucleic acid-binding protein
LVEVKSQVKICRDPKDNFLLALSKDGKANFLLTGDKDLLKLHKYGMTQILTITKFFEEIKHNP